MNRVEIEEWFQRLIGFTRDLLEGEDQGPIPAVYLRELLPDFWDEWFDPLLSAWTSQVRRDLYGFFLDQMKLQPADLVIRYSGLAVYSGLIHYLRSPDNKWMHLGMQIESIDRDGVRHKSGGEEWDNPFVSLPEDLKALVYFVAVSDTESWRTIQWEILNSYLIEDWDRASRYYDRARKLGAVDEPDLRLMLGQFQFLLAFRNAPVEPLQAEILRDNYCYLREGYSPLHPFNWEPQLYDAPNSLLSVFLLASGLAVSIGNPEDSRPERRALRDAIDALESARELRQLPPPYEAALARCYFAAGRFYDAAAQYEILLKQDLSGNWALLSSHVYRALATSYVSAEETLKAIEALQIGSSKFPKETDLYLRTAELQARETEYLAVKETLRKATENLPGFDDDWRYSSLLALGDIRQLSGVMPSPNKEDHDTIVAFLDDYWPAFKKLSDKARQQWVNGTFHSYFLHDQPQMAESLALNSRQEYAKALEVELAQRVFEPVREYFLNNAELKRLIEEELARNAAGGHDRDPILFCQFVVRKKPLTFGQKSIVLRLCARSAILVFAAMREWLQNHHPRLLDQTDHLHRVVNFRNTAEHELSATKDSTTIRDVCRAVIESIL